MAINPLRRAWDRPVPEIPIYQPADSEELRVLLPKLAEQFQFTVADAPGGFQSTAQTNIELLKHSDFVLIPVKPEFDAIEPLSVVQQIIEEARLENPLLEARVIINCLDGRTKTGRDPQSIVELIHAICPKLQVMNQKVRIDSSAFQTARINGSVVVEGGRSHAHEDLNALFAELLSDMVVTIGGHSQRLELAGNSSNEENMKQKRSINEALMAAKELRKNLVPLETMPQSDRRNGLESSSTGTTARKSKTTPR